MEKCYRLSTMITRPGSYWFPSQGDFSPAPPLWESLGVSVHLRPLFLAQPQGKGTKGVRVPHRQGISHSPQTTDKPGLNLSPHVHAFTDE